MKVAAYQAPLFESGSMEAIGHIKTQVAVCEDQGVEILCCPETVLGGWAEYADNPFDMAINVENGDIESVLAPLASDAVSVIVGFTEVTNAGRLYNTAAVYHKGEVMGIYRKVYPARNWSFYTAGDQLPTFKIGSCHFGIILCWDANYIEPASVIAAQGADVLFIPTNHCVKSHRADPGLVDLARSKHIAKAAEHGMTVVNADVSGHCGKYVSYGSSSIIDPNGKVVASAKLLAEDLLIADIECPSPDCLTKWDGAKNPAVVQLYRESCLADVDPYMPTPFPRQSNP